MALLALEDDAAGACRQAAGDDLHQRRLASAIVAEKGHHFAAADIEADVLQGFDGAEALGDVLEMKQRLGHGQRGTVGTWTFGQGGNLVNRQGPHVTHDGA